MTDPEWRIEPGLTDYANALEAMEARVEAIRTGAARELIWLVEHPPVYTAGTSATPDDLVEPERFPVFRTGRGGRYTYHGPGQRVGYVMLDLNARGRDVRCFVDALEDWMIAALARFGVTAFKAGGRVGVWTRTPVGEAKIGAIGVRVRRWISYHGFALNVAPDLSHFGGIVPCGLPDYPVTSLAALGIEASLSDADAALAATLPAFLERLSQRAVCR
jgi:lipoyl(octanoyl) transferase